MTNKEDPFSGIKNNWRFIVLIFLVGGAYFQFSQMQKDIETLNLRLDKKIKILNQNDDRIHELDKTISILQSKNCN